MNISELFEHTFEPQLIRELEQNAKHISIKEGDVIIDAGQMVRSAPLILSGSVKVSRMEEDGREILLYYVNPSESCAMTFTCCMQQQPSEIRAVAEEDVELLAVPLSLMDRWIAEYPGWKSFMMKTIRHRFNELLRTIDQIAFQKMDERLVHYLREKSKATGSALINLSHEQIAAELATSRVVVSRLLKKLENEKKLLLYRHQVKLLRDL